MHRARMRYAIWMLAACSAAGSPVEVANPPDGKSDDATCVHTALTLHVTSTTKQHQLTGEDDRARGEPTSNRTLSRFALWGTDLGASFSYAGRTYFLFGDSIDDGQGGHPACGDAIAASNDGDLTDGLSLDFLVDGNGRYVSPSVPNTTLGCYEVPLDGIGEGEHMYVWFSTDTMTRSVLARSDDGGASFTFVHALSSLHFINVSAVRDGDMLYLFGSGLYRDSEVYLARVPIAQIEDRDAYRFYAGTDGCSEAWSAGEDSAVPVFGPACVGELSAHHDTALGAWIVLYNCDEPRGIQARVASDPAGPWSEQASVFEPWANGGYCHFMHASYAWGTCDAVHDPGRENEWGGEYGPYVVEGASEALGERAAALYFVLSTWNPYNTMLMRTELSWDPNGPRADTRP